MVVRVPSPAELRGVAERIGFSLDAAELDSFIELMAPNIDYYNQVEAMPDELPSVRYPREPGYRPEAEENRTTRGTSRPRSAARPRASSRASGSPSKTTLCSRACR